MTQPQIKKFRGQGREQKRSGAASDETPGMDREELISTPDSWVGMVRTEPGMVSGWHHHSDNDTYIYVISGHARGEYGPGGMNILEAEPGDVLHVPKHIIHRESNPGADETVTFIVRVGTGPPVVNVDGPE